jgi:hypothetical protein
MYANADMSDNATTQNPTQIRSCIIAGSTPLPPNAGR